MERKRDDGDGRGGPKGEREGMARDRTDTMNEAWASIIPIHPVHPILARLQKDIGHPVRRLFRRDRQRCVLIGGCQDERIITELLAKDCTDLI